jgi:hypothetical protein
VKLVRILFIALVAIVVPVQGMAAVAAGQCMAFGHHDAGATHEHDAAHESGDHSAHSHAEASDEDDGSHCGPCTACCASASIAAANDLAFLPSASMAPYVFWQFPPFGDRPNALDRPPLAL